MIGSLFFVLYVCVVIGITILLLTLLIRFVKAMERLATAQEEIARNTSPSPR
ncbi:MAG: hypothetical protein U1G08_05780 [Verrucomicrobiota bacterium]